jgi:hypothetical protein
MTVRIMALRTVRKTLAREKRTVCCDLDVCDATLLYEGKCGGSRSEAILGVEKKRILSIQRGGFFLRTNAAARYVAKK